MRRQRRRSRLKAEMNVVPYIDVMLVLLVIFMIAAPLIHEQTIKVDLPDSPAESIDMPVGADSKVLPLILTVDAAGNYYLNRGDTPTEVKSPDEIQLLTAEALTEFPDLLVVVQGDAGAAYESIFAGIVLLQQAGASSVGLSSEPPKEKSAEVNQ